MLKLVIILKLFNFQFQYFLDFPVHFLAFSKRFHFTSIVYCIVFIHLSICASERAHRSIHESSQNYCSMPDALIRQSEWRLSVINQKQRWSLGRLKSCDSLWCTELKSFKTLFTY